MFTLDRTADTPLFHQLSNALRREIDRGQLAIGSLSKSISPSLRVGFIACQRDLAREFAQQKMLESLTNCEISEKLAAIILTEGRHRLSIERLRGRCEQAQRSVATGLENCGMQLFHRPGGGMFV